jgi:predicted nucleotide-binding protein
VQPGRAADNLRVLLAEANTPGVRRDGPEHTSWKAKVDALLRASLGNDSETLRQFRDLRYYIGVWSGAPGEAEQDAEYFASQVDRAAGLIEAAIYQLDLEAGEGTSAVVETTGPIFLVHGRDDARKYELMHLLERTAQPEVMVLHEHANRGETIIEQFERHAQVASFAIVLLTADDEGRLRGAEDQPLRPRGRQNVILELGVFIGLLGRKRVAILRDTEIEDPSDLSGLVYIPLDSGGAWHNKLLHELDAAGIQVYFDRIPSK